MTKKWIKHCGKKEKLHVLCNFFFCHYVFKNPSAADASESVYMRERVKVVNKDIAWKGPVNSTSSSILRLIKDRFLSLVRKG